MAAFDSGNIFELIDEMGDKIDNEYQKFTTLNIVVAGKTGVGKSTLINSVFSEKLAKTGYGDPVTEDIKKIRKEGYPLVIYDTPGLELKGEHSTQELLDDIQELIQSGMRTGDANAAIHAVWYCISTASGRIEPTEIEFLNQLSQRTSYCEVPFFVVLTKSISPEETDAMRAAIEGENLPITKVIPVLAEDYRIDAKRIVPAGGLDNLVYEMSNVLDESVQKTFCLHSECQSGTQTAERQKDRQKCSCCCCRDGCGTHPWLGCTGSDSGRGRNDRIDHGKVWSAF